MNFFTARITVLIFSTFLVALPSAVHAAQVMVPYAKFKAWPKAKRHKYIRDTARVYSAFEKATHVGMKFANSDAPSFWANLIPTAYAQSLRYCLVGGVRRDLSADGKCSTRNRGADCPQFPDGFKCGAIYNLACVSREPTSDLTNRCEAAAGPDMSRETYEQARTIFETIAQNCQGSEMDVQKFESNCTKFLARVTRLQTAYGGSTADWEKTDSTVPGDNGVPPIEQFGGTDAVPELQPDQKDEDQEKDFETAVTAPQDPVTPPREVVAPPPPIPPPQDCMSRESTQLGALACIACGVEEHRPADTAGGVTKWIALMGAMAQTYHGPYNVNDVASMRQYQLRVAEMVATFSYCTDNEFEPMTLPNSTRDWVDGNINLSSNRANQEVFATTFGLKNDRRATLIGQPRPFKYVNELFNVGNRWQANTPQANQWRFRSLLQSHRLNFDTTAFSRCGVQVERRMTSLRGFRMCPVENQQWRDIGGGMRVADEYGANTEFMSKMLRKCGLGAIRPPTSERCNTDCINSGNWPRNLSNVPNCICRNCDNDNGNDDGNDNNNNNNNNNNNGNDGKPGEPSTERSQEEPESSR